MTTSNLLMIAAASLALAACDEIPQDAAKPFAGKEETRSYGKTLADRADTQDEYLIMEEARKPEALAAK